MRYSSNIDELAKETAPGVLRLDGPASTVGFSTVGQGLADELALRIAERGEQQRGPDGYWRDNAPSTQAQKGFNKPNYETGTMMSPDHIAGEVTSTAREMEMIYGTGEAYGPEGRTDRDRAWYANEAGQGSTGVLRPFFGMNDADEVALTEIVADEWDRAAGGAAAWG